MESLDTAWMSEISDLKSSWPSWSARLRPRFHVRKHQNETCSKCYTKHFHIKDQIFQVFYYQGFIHVITFYLDTCQKCWNIPLAWWHSSFTSHQEGDQIQGGAFSPRVCVCSFSGRSGFPSQTSKNMYKVNIQSETSAKCSDEALEPILLYIYIMYMWPIRCLLFFFYSIMWLWLRDVT